MQRQRTDASPSLADRRLSPRRSALIDPPHPSMHESAIDLIFRVPGQAQAFSTAITTADGIRMRPPAVQGVLVHGRPRSSRTPKRFDAPDHDADPGGPKLAQKSSTVSARGISHRVSGSPSMRNGSDCNPRKYQRIPCR